MLACRVCLRGMISVSRYDPCGCAYCPVCVPFCRCFAVMCVEHSDQSVHLPGCSEPLKDKKSEHVKHTHTHETDLMCWSRVCSFVCLCFVRRLLVNVQRVMQVATTWLLSMPVVVIIVKTVPENASNASTWHVCGIIWILVCVKYANVALRRPVGVKCANVALNTALLSSVTTVHSVKTCWMKRNRNKHTKRSHPQTVRPTSD